MDVMDKIELIYIASSAVVSFITMPFVLKKAGYPAWAGIVPVYNTICMTYSTFGNPWLAVLLLVPGINLLFYFVLLYEFVQLYGFDTRTGHPFHHRGKFAIYMSLFPWLLWPLFAFGPATYMGEWRGPDPFAKKCNQNKEKCEVA